MISVGVRDLKNNLSRFLRSVKAGEEVVVTDHGKPVARIVQERPEADSVDEAMRRMEAEGLITRARKPLRKNIPMPPKAPGKPLSEIVIEDRG